VLLLGLLNGFNSRIQENPAVPADVKAQISKATEAGIPIVTTDQAYKGLRDAGLSSADATTVTNDYARAQLDALRTSMLAVAFLAVLSFWFTRRLPGKREEAASGHVVWPQASARRSACSGVSGRPALRW
jgi:hypothetical protein